MDDFLIVPFGAMRKSEISSVSRYLDEIRVVSKTGVTFSVDFKTRESLDTSLNLLCEWLVNEGKGDFGLEGED